MTNPNLILLLIASLSSTLSEKFNTQRTINDNDDHQENWLTIKATQNEIRVAEGELVELECEAAGIPQPQVGFFEDSLDFSGGSPHHLQEHSSTALAKTKARLRFIAKKSQLIFCKATSGRQTAHDTIKIDVFKSKSPSEVWDYRNEFNTPRITFVDTIYMDEIGNTAILPCRNFASEKSKTIWLNPVEEVLDGDDKFIVTPLGDLKIIGIEWSDLGPYTCLIKNSYGEDSATTFLYPMANE